MAIEDLFSSLPEVTKPLKKLTLKQKLFWTGIGLLLYFILSMLPLYGLDASYVSQFEALATLLAASFGSVITLGIGPLVTGSIILQLLSGAEVIKIDTHTPEGKKKYQSLQKAFSIFFIIFENAAYVLSGALPAQGGAFFYMMLLIVQLCIGGFILMLLDEVSSKWGLGSGISLFIAAGVSREIITKAISIMPEPSGSQLPIGAIPKIITLISQGNAAEAFSPFLMIVATIVVFFMAIYFSCVQINIPLSFGKVRGFGIKWPIKWFYTSNIPVILTAALMASLQFWALMAFNAGVPILGNYEERMEYGKTMKYPVSGIVKYLNAPTITDLFSQGFNFDQVMSLGVYFLFMTVGAVLFSYLWLNVGKASPGDVADQILSSGLGIPGFRRDKKILEKILSRYIVPLAILGGFTVGVLATIADVLNALSRGTGLLLTVMIVYQFYESAIKQHSEEINPLLRKVSG